ncbi:acyltransferase family protein [Pontibacter anaerobius]|uniref:Acyltransferase n=1 Tax=Pontibacter anaerobius TaxID=2993940 RepID=A0ABT3RD71_9BACT|nr:acyltransferase [Pontibacter anaerobius]MCX2739371.1 acyltransferase [Pontibacter anaerobius]
MKQHLQQIDVVKGTAIVAVLLLHSLTRDELENSYAIYHIWQAVPLFMVVMGLNLGLSVRGKTQHLQQLYTRKYFTKKAARIFIPFIIIFLLSIVAGILWEYFKGEDVLEFSGYTWVGLLPVTGRGNYFITMLLQSVLLLPVIGYSFSRSPLLTTVVLVLLELAFQFWAAQFSYFDANNYLYDAAFPRYFTAIVYGLWLSQLVWHSFRWKHFTVLASLGIVAAGFLYLFGYKDEVATSILRPEWQSQQALTFGYAALLVWLAIKLLPNYSIFIPIWFLAELGKASYHIFLVQVLYFGLVEQDLPMWLNLAFPIVLGYFFFKYESKLLFGL